MNLDELIQHVLAVGEQYEIDSAGVKASHPDLARFYAGKANGFYVAAAWMKEYLKGDNA